MAEPESGSTNQAGGAAAAESVSAPASAGPGFLSRALSWLSAWHPLIFMSMAAGLAVAAWRVYPEAKSTEPPSAEAFYHDGVDRLYRVINPDLPLTAPTPMEESLAARNAFMNLFVFHRASLADHPEFVNPSLLLAEANRILSELNPSLAGKYRSDADTAYVDAAIWERLPRQDAAAAAYAAANFLDGRGRPPRAEGGNPLAFLEENADLLKLRRDRRDEYIKYRLAESDVAMNRPELARDALEEIRRGAEARRRDELRRSIGEEAAAPDIPLRVFELGPDELRNIDFLLAKACDALSQPEQAKALYLRYIAATASGDSHVHAIERLAAIFREEAEVYRRADPERASSAYAASAGYYRALADSPTNSRERRTAAFLGLAEVNSRLADLPPAGSEAGIDLLTKLGRTVGSWLAEFSGQPLPRRATLIPLVAGGLLAKPELAAPVSSVVASVPGGSFAAMSGGAMVTPTERRRGFLAQALAGYDQAAANLPEGEARDRAQTLAARESWLLGFKSETEARFEKMLDPLSSPDLILAARLGLAIAALDRGDLRRAGMLILGGRAHPLPLLFTESDAAWRTLAVKLGNPAPRAGPGAWRAIWNAMPEDGRGIALYTARGRRLDDDYVRRFIRSMNSALRRSDFYRAEDFPAVERGADLARLLARPLESLNSDEVIWRNRLLLEEAFPSDLSRRGSHGVVGFEPFPAGDDLAPGGLVDRDGVREVLLSLARQWAAMPPAATPEESARRLEESAAAYRAALDLYRGEPGEILHQLARNREALAVIREGQGRHPEALSLVAEAGRNYLGVSYRAQGSPHEMQALLDAGDAFFRAGLLERTIESQERFLDRFGYSAIPGTEAAMSVSRAENLLGRAYWFLNDTKEAVASFRRNIGRRTPERYKSIYYIGRVLLDEGMARDDPVSLGSESEPLPELDRDGDPVILSAMQAFNHLRQSPGINPSARAWRWSTFDLGRLRHALAERARRAAASAPVDGSSAESEEGRQAWLALYDRARASLAEALERYPLRRNGGTGLSVRVEPADYADVMASRFETEYLLARTLLILEEGRGDESLAALARAHLENLRDDSRYAAALFDPSLDRFQLNAAIIREELGEGGAPLERSRLGDDEGPMHSPERFRALLRNSLFILAREYFRAGENAAAPGAEGERSRQDAAAGFYYRSYGVYQDISNRFGGEYGSQAMVGMGDALARLGRQDDAANHYRMAMNMATLLAAGSGMGPGSDFWSGVAESRLRDMAGGYRVP
ncbi:MAG: hypothetical protein LBV15_01640 [Planctomycetota bacterium]|jgi:hypothetical protein|nr:hypothetical protein [Planctomycetota bacterium]